MKKILSRLTALIDTADTIPIEPVEPQFIVERGGLIFYTVTEAGDVKEVVSRPDLETLPVVILVNTLLQKILIIKLFLTTRY